MRKTGMRYVRTWWGLSLAEKIELPWIVVLASVAEVAVKRMSLLRLTSLLGIALAGDNERGNRSHRKRAPMNRASIASRARMVDRVYRHWPRAQSCLRRAVVLGFRIRRAHPTLFIGVAQEDGDIRAHAWIEVDGEVVGEESGDWAPLRSHENPG